jgi:WD40 repeat protein
VELPNAFLVLIDATQKVTNWERMKEEFKVAKQTYQGNKGKHGWIAGRGDARKVLIACAAFHMRLKGQPTPRSLGFTPEAIELLKAVARVEVLAEALAINCDEAERLLQTLFPSERPGSLIGIPPLPEKERYLKRDAVLTACRDLLLGSAMSGVAITAPAPARSKVALRGMGGAGKSVTAIALARDEKVRKAFSDGLIWIEVGQASAGAAGKRSEVKAKLARRLGLSFEAESDATDLINDALASRRCLIILDDVWHPNDVNWVNLTGSESRLLITTRHRDVAHALNAEEYSLERFNENESLELLQKWSGRDTVGDPEARLVARECGCLPLALAISGAIAAGGVSWVSIAIGLKSADISFLKQEGIDPEYESVLRSIQASIDFLCQTDPNLVALYKTLAVVPPDETIPESVVLLLWQHAEGCPPHRSEVALTRLAAKSLLTLTKTQAERQVSLHDLHHDYLRYTQPELKGLHQIMVEAYREKLNPALGWSSLPDDKYIFHHLPEHLGEAGLRGERRALLLDCDWLTAKLKATDVARVLDDYAPFAADQTLNLVEQSLRLSTGQLSADPGSVRSQIYGRLVGVARAETLSELKVNRSRRPWLRSLIPSLIAPGSSLISTLCNCGGLVLAVAVFADGSRAISASENGALRVWDPDSGKELHVLRNHERRVTAVAVFADGSRAISASEDGTLRVWDLDSGKQLQVMRTHRRSVPATAVAVFADGSRAISGSEDGRLKVWDLDSGEKLQAFFPRHWSRVTAVAVFANGSRAISASEDGELRVWDLDSGEKLQELRGHSRIERALAVSADGSRAVSAPLDCMLWAAVPGYSTRFRMFRGNERPLYDVALPDDWDRKVPAAVDGTLRVWDLDSGKQLQVLNGHDGRVTAFTVFAHGSRAVSASVDGTLRVWDLDSGKQLQVLRTDGSTVKIVAVFADGSRAVSASLDGTLRLWDLRPRKELEVVRGHDGCVTAVGIVADGSRAISASEDGTLRVWDLDSGKQLHVLRGHERCVTAEGISANGSRAISASEDGTLRVWDLDSGKQLHVLRGHEGTVNIVSIGADGTRAVSPSQDRTLKVWDLNTGKQLQVFGGIKRKVYYVAVCADCRRAVTASLNSMLTVWDLDSGKELHVLRGHERRVTAVGISANGSRAISASEDGTLRVWDLDSGKELHVLRKHEGSVTVVGISANGSRAVFSSEDKALRAWDLDSGEELQELCGHKGWITAVGIVADGSRAVSSSEDGTLRVWDLKAGRNVATFTADSALCCCAISPGQESIVAGDIIGRVHCLRLEDG